MTDAPLDWKKPLMTEDGQPVRLLCDDFLRHHYVSAYGTQNRIVAVTTANGRERLAALFDDGSGDFVDDEGTCVTIVNRPPDPPKMIERSGGMA